MPNLSGMKESLNRGMTGEASKAPGHFWMFIQRWMITRVYEDADGVLRASWPDNKKVSFVEPSRWGKEF